MRGGVGGGRERGDAKRQIGRWVGWKVSVRCVDGARQPASQRRRQQQQQRLAGTTGKGGRRQEGRRGKAKEMAKELKQKQKQSSSTS